MQEAGKFCQTLGWPFHIRVLEYFKTWVNFTGKELEFIYSWEGEVLAKEVYCSKYSRVPVTTGIWLAAPALAAPVAHLFIFYSAIEALSFFSLYARSDSPAGSLAFAAIGLHPTMNQIRALRARFKHAKIHLVFGRELPSRILDCKAALWTKGIEMQFHLLSSSIYWHHKGRNYYLHQDHFSLFQFEQTCGIRFGIRTHKPLAGFNSYLQFLQFKNPQS